MTKRGNSTVSNRSRDALDHRKLFVGVGTRIPVARKMFSAGHDPVALQPRRRRHSQFTDHIRRRAECPIADDRIVRITVHVSTGAIFMFTPTALSSLAIVAAAE